MNIFCHRLIMKKCFLFLLRSSIGLRDCFSECITFGDRMSVWVKNDGSWNVERREFDLW